MQTAKSLIEALKDYPEDMEVRTEYALHDQRQRVLASEICGIEEIDCVGIGKDYGRTRYKIPGDYGQDHEDEQTRKTFLVIQ